MRSSRLEQWHEEHLRPVIRAYWMIDYDAAVAARGHALDALLLIDSVDLRAAAQLRLGWVWMIALEALERGAEAWREYDSLLAQCAQPQPGPVSAATAARIRLQTRLHADCLKHAPVQRAELDELLGELSDDERTAGIWGEVACWAFSNRDRPLMEQAYAHFATTPDAAMPEFMFARLRLMHQLLARSASAETVEAPIACIDKPLQLIDFQRMVMPAVESAGLRTPQVESALRLKRAELEQAVPRVTALRGWNAS